MRNSYDVTVFDDVFSIVDEEVQKQVSEVNLDEE